ncbi:TIGR03086 family metal-binding protein [Streptomyces sp. 891-h]|uniref:TIGR03086 family metal-binding protein n=1 Tax=unclassified Streptomyces TaxID=2593676 RepID=UPI001FAA3407|nr:TIGR03086 family metal-binding protein [Streptomyces sp. 891-h]UNZ18491.1 TIGR03086 family protein [Streptomyces sp. 891-h]
MADSVIGAAGAGGGAEVPVDLRPAARRTAAVVAGVEDAQLGDPTPCTEFAVRDLLRHIDALAVGLQYTARKELGEVTAAAAGGVADRPLPDDWRERLPHDLADLAVAWSAPDAWTGTTQAGGFTLTGTEGGLVTLDELVVHGWDLARATRQDYQVDEPGLRAVRDFLAAGVSEDGEQGIFGPVVHVDAEAPLLDQVVGLAGRDPAWQPPGSS